MTDPDSNITWLKEGLSRVEKSVNKLSEKLDMYNDRFETKESAVSAREVLSDRIDHKADRDDVENIQATLTWLTRLVLGTVIVAALSLIRLNINI